MSKFLNFSILTFFIQGNTFDFTTDNMQKKYKIVHFQVFFIL